MKVAEPERKPSLLNKLVTGGLWALLGKLATYPLALVLSMVIARVLTPPEVGGYFLCMSIVMLSAAIIQGGMGTTMVRSIAAFLAERNSVAVRQSLKYGLWVVATIGTVAFLLLSGAPGRWFMMQSDAGAILLPSLSLLAGLAVAFAAVEFSSEVLRGFHDQRGASILAEQALQRLILMMFLLTFVVYGWSLNLNQVLFYSLASALLSVIVGAGFVFKRMTSLENVGHSVRAREILVHAPPFLLIRLNFWLLNSSAILVLGIFQPPEQVALYGAANVLAALVIAPWAVCNSALSPTVAALYRRNELAALSEIAKAGATLAALPAALIAATLILYGNEVLKVVFSEQFVGAGMVLTILAAGRLVSVSCGAPAMIMSMTNQSSILLRVLVSTSIITLVAYVYFAESLGINGIAWITAVSYASQGISLAAITKKKLGFFSFPMLSLPSIKSLVSVLGKRDSFH